MLSYVWRDLVRNPRRTLASLVGVMLGVGLFSGVLFFIDGSGAAMTKRALAPLALDMQRVLTSPLGGGLGFEERVSGPSSLRPGQRATITLTVRNGGAVPVNEVVMNDEPPPPLAYVMGTTRLNGKALRDKGGQSPLAQGLARSGLNIGTVRPGTTVTLTYVARAQRAVGAVRALRLRGKVSSREDVVPAPANAPPQLGLDRLRARVARLPGVAAADGLSFVDLPPGSLRAGGSTVRGPVRVFAFDRRYQEHYPSIRVASGSFRPGSALLSAEAARALAAGPGATVELRVPGRPGPLSLPVSGVTDLARAKPLFYSRKTNKLEDFLYVPDAVIVTPRAFEHTIVPAFRAANAARGSLIKSLPAREVDVLVDRSRLHSDPARALAQTKAVARSINRVAPGQDYLIDNVSNALEVARDDAVVGRRMFVFLGLPGVLLAAFLAAYAGSILASTLRREQANLRIRGAHRGHLRRMLAYRTLAFAGLGSVVGTGFGFLSSMAILGRDTLFEAAAKDLVLSGLLGIGVGMLTTGVALYVPGRRSLRREVSQERREMMAARAPAWRRWRLDYALLAAAAIAEVVAYRAGAFDPPTASVSAGEAVSLPSRLLLAPLIAWLGGVLLSVRIFLAIAARIPLPAPPRFGPVIRGILGRSLRRRSWAPATGILGVGLVVAFGMSLAMFAATYDAAKAADSRFVVGSDVRVTPSVLSPRPHPPGFASKLEVPGVSAVTPVVSKLENSVLIGRFNQDRRNLTAIDPAGFERVAALSDSFFVDRSAAGAMAALRGDPRGLLVESQAADDLSVETGDRVRVLLARGTKSQTLKPFRVVGLFERLPGFPQGTDLVVNLSRYAAATGSRRADFFLARAADGSHAGLARAVGALRSGPGRGDPLNIDTRETALDKDQSSLTALNVHGLVDLDSLYTLLMSAAAIAIFVFGLMLQRRREYVTLRAQGLQTRELHALVLGEAALVAVCGLTAGALVGTGMAYLLVHILRPLFILDPSVTFPGGEIAMFAALALAATLASALTATAILRRLRPTEVLREA
ncbi:MAG TPA: FtsX-like permease family protein [Solirubrobacteraceae bacterium]|nr:FtsX-like permease family protein [Solirubrobacteraceae bacterium]